MGSRLLVLAWHNIEPTWFFHGTSPEAGRRTFERQVHFLRRWTTVVPLRSALADLAAGRPLPPRAVALTFDDGYLDHATVAAPLLEAAGLQATFFLTEGFLSGDVPAWWEEVGWAFAHARTAELQWEDRTFDTSSVPARRAAAHAVSDMLKTVDSGRRRAAVAELSERLASVGSTSKRQFMDWDDAKQLLRRGQDVGAHTREHPILSLESPSAQARELIETRRRLSNNLDQPIDVLAYPNGQARDYSPLTLQLAREAGYEFAVTTRPGLARAHTPPLEVPRVQLVTNVTLPMLYRKGIRVMKRIASPR